MLTRGAYRHQNQDRRLQIPPRPPHKIHVSPKMSVHILKSVCVTGFYVCLMAILAGVGLFFYYASTAPHLNTQALHSDNAVRIYDTQGDLISKLGDQNRKYIHYKNVPPSLIDSLTSIEDRHFFTEKGVDPIRIGEASVSNLVGRGSLQGGSTLTQQLIKLSVFSTGRKDQTIKRKAQEAWLALRLNHNMSKQRILEYYINKVYMGHDTYGMQTASEYYFNKPLNKISLPQTAMLAGMPQSPINYDPYAHPGAATQRRNEVLNAMYENHKLSKVNAQRDENTPISLGLVHNHSLVKPSAKEKIASDYVKQVVQELDSHNFNMNSGLKVYTNLNMKDQKTMYNLANHSKKPGWPNDDFQVGAALVNANNGNVQAIIGGRKEADDPTGINRADSVGKSNGSTNKPLMDYGPAMQYLGYEPDRTVYDTPFVYPGTHVELKDFDHRYEGAMSMKSALVQSRNVPAIRALQDVGVSRAIKFMNNLGLPIRKKGTTLQNGIGEYVSPLREAVAYATFANGGMYHQPLEVNHIITRNGKRINFHSSSHRAMSKDVAYSMDKMLKGVPNSADGYHAKVPGLVTAGKTGTTQYPVTYKYHLPNYAAMDSWYAGMTPNQAMAIWTGYDNPMLDGHYINVKQINIAQTYFKLVMENASEQFHNTDW